MKLTTVEMRCDRCELTIEVAHDGDVPTGWRRVTKLDGNLRTDHDLCRTCSDSFDEFMRNHPVDADRVEPVAG